VLVVEDEQDARDVVTLLLEGSGADVRIATSATEALAHIDARMPDLIVADIGLLDEDGYSFIARVRAREGGSADRVPALALTAYGRPEDRDRALAAGYQVHVGKPFVPGQVIATVARLARQSREARAIEGTPSGVKRGPREQRVSPKTQR
jgi:CheY-like chemotaxis protein